jgi:DNA-binding transcriptional regulator YiaG
MKRKKSAFAEKVLRGAREAVAIARGETKPARLTRRVLASGAAHVHEPPNYDAQRIRRLRERLNMSQPVFARSLNASDATVKAWEQGKRVPEGTSLRLLELAEKEPAAFARLVGIGATIAARSAEQSRPQRAKKRSISKVVSTR